jgi:predicted enzyme related to lactoylglutathione lyase
MPVAAQDAPTRAVIWHELVTQNIAAVQPFYGELFGWTFAKPTALRNGTFVAARLDGTPVAGLVQADASPSVNTSQWLTYFHVTDVEGAVNTATSQGATVLVRPTVLRGRGRGALMTDPEGAPFAVLSPDAPAPWQGKAPMNGWLWNELFAKEPVTAAGFYGKVLGFETLKRTVGGADYDAFGLGGTPVAGLMRIPVDGVHPNWLPMIRVDDVDRIVAKATALGGRVIMPPRPDVRHGNAAIIADPSGAAFAVQVWDGATGT